MRTSSHQDRAIFIVAIVAFRLNSSRRWISHVVCAQLHVTSLLWWVEVSDLFSVWARGWRNISPLPSPTGTPRRTPGEESAKKYTCHNMSALIKADKTTDQILETPRSLWQYLWGVGGGRDRWYSTDTAAERSGAARKQRGGRAAWAPTSCWSVFLALASWEHRFLSIGKELNNLYDIFNFKFLSWRFKWGEIWKDHAV